MQLKPFALLIRTIDRTFPFAAAAILVVTKGPNWALNGRISRPCDRPLWSAGDVQRLPGKIETQKLVCQNESPLLHLITPKNH